MRLFARLALTFSVAYAIPTYGSELFSAIGNVSQITGQISDNQPISKSYYYSDTPIPTLADHPFNGGQQIYEAAAQTDFGTNKALAFASDTSSTYDTAAAISIWSDFMAPVYSNGGPYLEGYATADVNIHGFVVNQHDPNIITTIPSVLDIHYLAILSADPISVGSFMGMLTGTVPVPQSSSISQHTMLDLWLDQSSFPTQSWGQFVDYSYTNLPIVLSDTKNQIFHAYGYVTSGLFVSVCCNNTVNIFNTVDFTVNLPPEANLLTDSGSSYGAALVPEAETWAMLLVGLVLVGGFTRQSKRVATGCTF